MHYTLCDYLLDLFANALEAGSPYTRVDWEEDGHLLRIRVTDRGSGMTSEELERARDPFYSRPGKHPERRVGLGLPFLLQTAEATGGNVDIESEPGTGTTVECRFPPDHVDLPPVGDVAGTFLRMCLYEGDYEVEIHRRRGPGAYRISRRELAEALGDLESADSVLLLRRYLYEQERELETMEV
ncbi:MAG: sensor histidine kinase [Spirochaetota bacterium]